MCGVRRHTLHVDREDRAFGLQRRPTIVVGEGTAITAGAPCSKPARHWVVAEGAAVSPGAASSELARLRLGVVAERAAVPSGAAGPKTTWLNVVTERASIPPGAACTKPARRGHRTKYRPITHSAAEWQPLPEQRKKSLGRCEASRRATKSLQPPALTPPSVPSPRTCPAQLVEVAQPSDWTKVVVTIPDVSETEAFGAWSRAR